MSYQNVKTAITGVLKLLDRFQDTYSASTISFDATGKQINDTGLGLAFLAAGDSIAISGSISNDGAYKVVTGGQSDHCIVAESLVSESAGASITLSAPKHVSGDGSFRLLDRGIQCAAILTPGPFSQTDVRSRMSIREWVAFVDVFTRFTDDETSWANLAILRDEVISTLEMYPTLNNSAGIVRVRVSASDEAGGVFDKQGGGPLWLYQRLNVAVTERADLSGGEYS